LGSSCELNEVQRLETTRREGGKCSGHDEMLMKSVEASGLLTKSGKRGKLLRVLQFATRNNELEMKKENYFI
jgi:hypothetical protein